VLLVLTSGDGVGSNNHYSIGRSRDGGREGSWRVVRMKRVFMLQGLGFQVLLTRLISKVLVG
jgi:hypothetical protein